MTKWTRKEDGGHPVFTDGTFELRRMDDTARSRFSWVLFRDGEPVTKPGRFGKTILSGRTLAQAKRIAELLKD